MCENADIKLKIVNFATQVSEVDMATRGVVSRGDY